MSPNAGFTVHYAADWAKPDLGRFLKETFRHFSKNELWGLRRFQWRASGHHYRTSGRCHSRFSLWPWLLAQVFKRLTCAMHAWWILVLCTLGDSNRLFLRWSGLHPWAWLESTPLGPLLLFRINRGLFPVHARARQISLLVVRCSRDSSLRACRRVALWRTRSWSGQCSLVAAIRNQIRAELRA